jgi:adenylate kinase family enzyme
VNRSFGINALHGTIASVQRVVVLGRGGAGKSTAAVRLGQITGLPVIELDQHFWSADLRPLSRDEWVEVTSDLAAQPCWVMDGDLGPYDVLAPRLHQADTVLILDYGLLRCVWRARRRSRERADFWWWVLTWRLRSRPVLLQAIAEHAPTAECHIVKKPKHLTSWFAQLKP